MLRLDIIKRFITAPKTLFFLTFLTLIIPNIALCATEHLSWMACLVNTVLPLGAYWWAMTLSTKPGKMTWALFIFIFFSAFQIVLLYLFGRGVIAVDMFLNLVTTNPTEAGELLDNLLPGVVSVFVIYLPVLILGVVSLTNKKRLNPTFVRKQRRYSLALLAVGIVLAAVCKATEKDYKFSDQLFPANVCYNMWLAVERTGKTNAYDATSAGFRYHATSTHSSDSSEIYVLVIGETARAGEFGIYGYKRNTTPELAKVQGLAAFTNVLTQSNTTHKSVPMLMSLATAEDYDCIYRTKGIVSAFREAGFHTTFLSNQRPNHSFIDIFGKEADDCRFIKESLPADSNVLDESLLTMMKEVLEQHRKKEFIVLHTYGSHFNYRERYPQQDAYFKPEDEAAAKYENRQSLLNAYDNSIRYTDKLLAGIIGMLEKRGCPSAMLYTSDHGENIFDDSRRLFLHASPTPSCYELRVPLLVWTSQAYGNRHPAETASLKGNLHKPVQSSVSVIHTMLQLGGIRTDKLQTKHSLASPDYHCGKRHYLNDHNLPLTLDKTGMTGTDFHDLKAWGITGL